MQGRIIRGIGGFYYVRDAQGAETFRVVESGATGS